MDPNSLFAHLGFATIVEILKTIKERIIIISKKRRQYPPYKVKLYSYSIAYDPVKRVLNIKKEVTLTAKTDAGAFIEYPPLENRNNHSIGIKIWDSRIRRIRRVKDKKIKKGYYSQFDSYSGLCYSVEEKFGKGGNKKLIIEYNYPHIDYERATRFIENEPVVEYEIPIFAVCRPSRTKFGLSIPGGEGVPEPPRVLCVLENHTIIEIGKLVYAPDERQYVVKIKKAYPSRRYIVRFSLITSISKLRKTDIPDG